MSRIGNAPVIIPEGVEVNIDANKVSVKGPKGELHRTIDPRITMKVEEGELICSRSSEEKEDKSLHGLSRSLINNMVEGVSKGYKKELELVGVGYRASNSGQKLELSLGFSHAIVFELPAEIKITTQTERGKNPIIILESFDKELIGQVAAKIRSFRKPEPFKGKGVRFVGEHIRRKAGKAAGK